MSVITRTFSHRLNAVRVSRKIPGSQASYIFEYADGAAIFPPYIVYTDGSVVFAPHIGYADGAVIFPTYIVYADAAAVFAPYTSIC